MSADGKVLFMVFIAIGLFAVKLNEATPGNLFIRTVLEYTNHSYRPTRTRQADTSLSRPQFILYIRLLCVTEYRPTH